MGINSPQKMDLQTSSDAVIFWQEWSAEEEEKSVINMVDGYIYSI